MHDCHSHEEMFTEGLTAYRKETINFAAILKHCPVTPSASKAHKLILTNRRHKCTAENIEMLEKTM
jgi:hypothetical protein